MVRASGSYPLRQGFESLHRHHSVLGELAAFFRGTAPVDPGDRVLTDYGQREFTASEHRLSALLADFPDDLSVARLLELARGFRAEPPPDDWDGTTTYHEK